MGQPTATPELRGAARREQILDVAERILEADGIEAFTMRRLADEVGIRAPSLYKHWKDKAALFAALQGRALADFGEELRSVGSDLTKIAIVYRRWARDHPAMYELNTRRPLARDQIDDGVEERAAEPVVAAVGGDEDRARVLWAAAHGLVDLELADRFPPGADLDAAWAVLVDAFSPR